MEETGKKVNNLRFFIKKNLIKTEEYFRKELTLQKNSLKNIAAKYLKGTRSRVKIVTIASLLLINLAPLNSPLIEMKVAEAVSQSDLDKINAEIGDLNSLLTAKRNEKSSLENEIAIYEAQIKQLQLQIEGTNLQIEKTNGEINSTNKEISKLLEQLKVHKEDLKENIRILYEEGRVSAVEVFASSENFSDYLDNNEYLLTVQGKVKETMEKINVLRRGVETKRASLEDKKKELEELKKRQNGQKTEINSQKSQKDALLAKTSGQEAAYAASVETKRAAYNKLQAELDAILNKPRFVSQGYVKRGDIIGYEGNTGYSFGAHLHWGVYIGSQDVDPTSYVDSGRLANPLPGAPITQGYWGSFSHRGMGWPGGWDLASYNGAPIHAADNGNIIVNENSGPFGHHIIIEHSGGLRTLYAHMQ